MIVFVIEPIRNCVSAVARAPALPVHASSPPSSTPATIEGSLRSAW